MNCSCHGKNVLDEPWGSHSTGQGCPHQPSHWDTACPHCRAPCGLSGPRQANPSKAVCCQDLHCLEVWSSPWAASGLHWQGQELHGCAHQVVLGCSPHYGTLDQKADEMEVLGRWLQTKSAWGQTTGPEEGRNGGTATPPLLPAPEKLSPGHEAEKKEKEG